jgi:hypothetical protein
LTVRVIKRAKQVSYNSFGIANKPSPYSSRFRALDTILPGLAGIVAALLWRQHR